MSMLNKFLVVLLSLSAFLMPALAKDKTDSDTPPGISEKASAHLLKGGVRGAALRTEDGLNKIGETAEQSRRFCLSLAGEVSRKETVTVRPPNVLPGEVVIPAFPSPTGTIPMGALPARQKYVDYLMSELASSVQLLQSEIDALIIPEDKTQLVAPQWTQIREQMHSVQATFAELKDLTADATKYNNEKIGIKASTIYDQMKVIHKLEKEMLKAIRSG